MLGQGIYSLFFDALAHSCNLHYWKTQVRKHQEKENCIKQSADKSQKKALAASKTDNLYQKLDFRSYTSSKRSGKSDIY